MYKALGIIQIVLGIGGALYALVSVATTAFASSMLTTSKIYDTQTLVFMYLHAAASVATGAALLATGIGVVKAKRWARPVGVGYAVVSLLSTYGGTAVNVLVIQPKITGGLGGPLGSSGGFEAIIIVSAIFGALMYSIMPVVTLIALLRARAKEELDG